MRHLGLLALVLAACGGKEPAFDIAYANDWKFSVEGPVSGYLVLVNTSDDPLSLQTLQVGNVTDDHPTATVDISAKIAPTSTLQPGQAGGFLTPLAKGILVDSGLVKEPRADTATDYLSISIADAPEGTYDIKASVDLTLEGITTTLPLTIHVVPGPTVLADPQLGTRVALTK